MAGGEEFVVAGVEVEDEVDGGREALVPVLAEEVAVGCRKERVRWERSQQTSEGAGEEKCAGARVHALAGDVRQDDFEGSAAVRAGGHDEVARERLAACGA